MEVWQFIHDKLNASQDVMLLYVLESEGSSPGRQGFKMAVASDGNMTGTIGGGIMEHKLVEKARQMLADKDTTVTLMRQHHHKEVTRDQSGMICSGSQLNVFIPVLAEDREVVDDILKGGQASVILSPSGISLRGSSAEEQSCRLNYQSEEDWEYSEKLNLRHVIHIIGGGHVSLALSELMCFLGFYSKVYDERPQLNTILQNFFANEKIVVPGYDHLGEYIPDSPNDFVVIMTQGYRTDKMALQQLLGKTFYYIGMMGSVNKIETLFDELKAEGYPAEALKKVFTPIGINISSKTSQEIAVSIAAEIIREKNKG